MKIRGLEASYGSHQVLKGLDLKVEPGTLTAVLGQNGSGKSTLAKAILGLVPHTKGEIWIGNQRLDTLKPHERARHVAYVPQSETASFPFLVKDVVAMGRLSHGTGYFESKEDLERATEAMREADCLELATKPITELSGGEQQRVWMARALAQSTTTLILDEPTAHLDAGHVVAFAAIVRRLKQEGKTLLAIFHDLNLAEALADRFALLQKGELLKESEIASLWDRDLLETAFESKFSTFEPRPWMGPDYLPIARDSS